MYLSSTQLEVWYWPLALRYHKYDKTQNGCRRAFQFGTATNTHRKSTDKFPLLFSRILCIMYIINLIYAQLSHCEVRECQNWRAEVRTQEFPKAPEEVPGTRAEFE